MWRRAAKKVARKMEKELIRAVNRHKIQTSKNRNRSQYLPRWFNRACREARAEANKLSGANQDSEECREAKRKLQRLARIRRRIFKKKEDERFLRFLENKPRQFWTVVKKKKARLAIVDKVAWLRYGELLYDSVQEQHMEQGQLREDDGKEYFDEKLVRKAVKRLKRGKSADSNGITAEILKLVDNTAMVQVMAKLFNKITRE